MRISIFLSFVLLSFISSAQNLITNGGFESGFSGWSNSAGNGSVATFQISTTTVEQGTQAYSATISTVAAGANAWDIQTIGPTWTAVVGQSYTLTLYAMSSTAGADLRVVMQNANYLAQDFTLTTSWQAYTWTFTATETAPAIKFHLALPANAGKTIYVDNIQLPSPTPINVSFTDTAVINTGVSYQIIEGIGGALAEYQNWYTAHPNKSQIYALIFKGLGLTFLRLNNQYSDTTNTTIPYDPEFVTQAKASLGYTPKILISSWSPPAYMKLNGTQNGGTATATLNKNSNGTFMYPQFGAWWRKSLAKYAASGVYPDYISLQNEPNWNPTYPGCMFAYSQSVDTAGYPQALNAVDSCLTGMPNKPKIIGPESFGIGGNFMQGYLNKLNNAQLDGYAYHLYTGGNFSTPDSFIPTMQSVAPAVSSKQNFMTEFYDQNAPDTSDALNLGWMIHNTLVYMNASGYIQWDLLWGGGGSIIDVQNPWTPTSWTNANGYTVYQSYYALKQFSKFIRSGWSRISATTKSTNFRVSAYLSPTGDSMTVVILNVGTSNGTYGLNLGSFTPKSGTIYQTNTAVLQCDSVGVYAAGVDLRLPARSITTVTLLKNTTLPVTLLDFTVKKNSASTALLSWTSTNERNLAYYSVQRSYDGITFNSIGQVTAVGNGNNVTNYSYLDTSANLSRTVYYKLISIDNNGNSSASIVISLAPASSLDILLSPNPTNGTVTLQINDPAVTNVTVSVLNVLGNLVYAGNFKSETGLFNQQIDLSAQPSGIYFVKVTSPSGDYSGVGKVVKE